MSDIVLSHLDLTLARFCSIGVPDLSHTKIDGTIPIEISRLEILGEPVDFHSCFSQCIASDSIPVTADRLVLSNSSFSGRIPVDVANISRMRMCSLCRFSMLCLYYSLSHNCFSNSRQENYISITIS